MSHIFETLKNKMSSLKNNANGGHLVIRTAENCDGSLIDV